MSKIMACAYDNRMDAVADILLTVSYIAGALLAAFEPDAAAQLPLGLCMTVCFALIMLLSLCVSGFILIPACALLFGGICFAMCKRLCLLFSLREAECVLDAFILLFVSPAFFVSAHIAMRTSAAVYRAVKRSCARADGYIFKSVLALPFIIAPAVISTLYAVI